MNPLIDQLRRWSAIEPIQCAESLQFWSLKIGDEVLSVFHDPQSIHDQGIIFLAVIAAIKDKGWGFDCCNLGVKYCVGIFNLDSSALPWGNGESDDLVLATLIAYLEALEVLLSGEVAA